MIGTLRQNAPRWLGLAVLILLASCARPRVAAPPRVPPPEKAEAQKLLKSAEALYRSGRYPEALASLKSLLRDYPDTTSGAEGLLLQGNIKFLMGRYKEALAAYDRFAASHPKSPQALEARYNALRCLDSLGNRAQAISRGKELYPRIKDPPTARKVAIMLAENLHRIGRPDDAMRWFGQALLGSSQGEAKSLDEEVLAAAEELAPGVAGELLDTLPETPAASYLKYKEAKDLILGGDIDSATKVLATLTPAPFQPSLKKALENLKKSLEWPSLEVVEGKRPAVTIGLLLPLSGSLAQVGERALKAALLAADPFSRTSDMDVFVEIRDAANGPEGVKARVEELAAIPGLFAIVGPLSVSSSERAAEKAQELGVPIVVLSQKRKIADTGGYVFQNYYTPQDQTRRLTDYAMLGLGLKRFAILYPENPYGREMMNLFWDRVDELGGDIRGVESYATHKTDFSDEIKKLVGLYYPRPTLSGRGFPEIPGEGEEGEEKPGEEEKKPGMEDEEPLPIVDFEAIFLPDRAARSQLVIPQLLYHDVEDVRLLGTSLWHDKDLVEEAGRFMEGALFVDGFNRDVDDLVVTNFVKRFTMTFGYEPGFLEANTFDTVRMILYLIRDRALTERRQLKEGLSSLRLYRGTTGKIDFDKNGAAQRRLFVFTVKRGRTVEAPEQVGIHGRAGTSKGEKGVIRLQ